MQRTLFRWTVSFLAFLALTVVITPLLQANVQELAKTRGWDQYLTKSWGPAGNWLIEAAVFANQPGIMFVAGFFVGGAVCVWTDYLLRERPSISSIKRADQVELTPIIGRRFLSEAVQLDGYHYTNCTFRNVKLSFGGGAFSLTHNTFEGDISIAAATEELARFVQLLGEFGYLALPVQGPNGTVRFSGVKREPDPPKA